MQRSLYVHTTGFHALIKELLKNCKSKRQVQTNIWKVFYKLLESCHKTDYTFLVNDIARATDDECERIRDGCKAAIIETEE